MIVWFVAVVSAVGICVKTYVGWPMALAIVVGVAAVPAALLGLGKMK